MHDKLPTRLLNRSIFVLTELQDPRTLARLGWRAPIFAYIGLDKGAPVTPDFVYHASLMDVTGQIRARQELKVNPQVAAEMRARSPAAWAEGGPRHKPIGWEEALDGLSQLEQEDLGPIRDLLAKGGPEAGRDAFAAVCAVMDRYTRGSECAWQEFLQELERQRFSPSAWFERDRSNLSLHDDVLDRDVISLWDDEVAQEIDGGFLRVPRGPRPSEREWLQPLLDLATDRSLITPLRAPATQVERERLRP